MLIDVCLLARSEGSQLACTEIVIALGAYRCLVCSGDFDERHISQVVFKIMADYEGSIIGVGPGTALDDGQVGGLKSPLDCAAVNGVGIHPGVLAAGAHNGVENGMVDETALAITICGNEWVAASSSDYLSAIGGRPPKLLVTWGGPDDFLGFGQHLPIDRARRDVRHQTVFCCAGERQIIDPVIQRTGCHIQAHFAGKGKIAACCAVRVRVKADEPKNRNPPAST